MSKYAKIENNIVTNIIVCEDSQIVNFDGTFIKITENTGSAAIGLEYNLSKNKFIKNKPYDSWVLSEDLVWVSPIGDAPSDGSYEWNEEDQEWVKLPVGELQPSIDHVWDQETESWILP